MPPVGDSFAPILEPGGSDILLHREAGDRCLGLLLWAPVWRSEGPLADVALDQLKRYKGEVGHQACQQDLSGEKSEQSLFPELREITMTVLNTGFMDGFDG
ncbi:uncharacterized protein PADG_03027 [Paracoccidioides brasiliensis Pb18]|uniref:Uncharacterized protein n=1 Tax=Paracoccidioides brasiliensis (strain Pb18) TaxID=502780 RepID=C1G772_PARBD|nr:uncharacterized protein PADG_03027 [Paracoccidioides brasiliensis Pb18]EEH46929.1 hypothetical protein PADG_03027 [Paracoccidioides brasiliensis Pb18]